MTRFENTLDPSSSVSLTSYFASATPLCIASLRWISAISSALNGMSTSAFEPSLGEEFAWKLLPKAPLFILKGLYRGDCHRRAAGVLAGVSSVISV